MLPLCWWFCTGSSISWRPTSDVRSICGCIWGLWPNYQQQQLSTNLLATYIWCVILLDNSIDLEITKRSQIAANAFEAPIGTRVSWVWSQRGIKKKWNKLCRVFVQSCLLYSTETRTLYRRHMKKLTSVQLRHLRNTIGLTWQDKSLQCWSATKSRNGERWGHVGQELATMGWSCYNGEAG